MSGLKAIQTYYRGVSFRSRLEARWAVFFDCLDIRWQYEKQGYDLPSGNYLPDFWLPDILDGSWFEVKGDEPSELEELKGLELARLSGCRYFLVSGDMPAPDQIQPTGIIGQTFKASITTPNGDTKFDPGDEWAFSLCIFCNAVGISVYGDSTLVHRIKVSCMRDAFGSFDQDGPAHPIIAMAYQTARAARFDHGELPTKRVAQVREAYRDYQITHHRRARTIVRPGNR
jgi:hypothetical protein